MYNNYDIESLLTDVMYCMCLIENVNENENTHYGTPDMKI